jgi:dTDP-4-amino-4,6-dideoxygalactose transaminase
MNIDENLIEAAITPKTKAIVVVHYAGIACQMDRVIEIASKYKISVIEDAAQAMMSFYDGKACGTFGDYGCFSFHETKNYSMGEGGALLLNNPCDIDRAEIIREKGTNRSKFWRGEIDKYTWVDKGSSYLPSELNAAYLYPQLENADLINNKRLVLWNKYYQELEPLLKQGKVELPFVPKKCKHNGHMFYIKVKDIDERQSLIDFLKKADILSVFHYIPLHYSPAGQKFGKFVGQDIWTTKESQRLLRLPMYFSLQEDEVSYICQKVFEFYSGRIK